jgi:hypothetical protein
MYGDGERKFLTCCGENNEFELFYNIYVYIHVFLNFVIGELNYDRIFGRTHHKCYMGWSGIEPEFPRILSGKYSAEPWRGIADEICFYLVKEETSRHLSP